VRGRLFRRIPNYEGWWDPLSALPCKQAFAPGYDRNRVKETGISTYLVDLTDIPEVLGGHDPAFGVVLIDIAELHAAVETLRPRMGLGRNMVKPFGAFSVKFDPLTDPRDGPARHAHCWIGPMTPSVQKELVRLTSPSRVAKPCGLLRELGID
jgi:hypothetical protein